MQRNQRYQTSCAQGDKYFVFCILQPDDGGANSSHSTITTNWDFINWLIQAESNIQDEHLSEYMCYFENLSEQAEECKKLYADVSFFTYIAYILVHRTIFQVENTVDALTELKVKYEQVTTKTGSLHSLSEQLLKNQKQLRDKKQSIHDKLHHFIAYNRLYSSIEKYSKHINKTEFLSILDDIDSAIEYLNVHVCITNTYLQYFTHLTYLGGV